MNPGYKAFLETLIQHCRKADSGVLHCYTTQDHYGRVGLTAGEITHASLHTARGMTALPGLLDAAIRSYRFEPGALLPLMNDLLDTPDILALLGSNELAAQAVPAAIAAIATAANRPAAVRIQPSALRLIEQALQQELGPMATSLVQECLPRAASAIALAEALADQLMPAESKKFLDRVTELLRADAAQ